MALPNYAQDTINVVRAGLKTVRGAEVQDWANPTRHRVGGCSVQPRATTGDEVADRAAHATESCTVYLPLEADLKRGDRVEWDGDTWDVDGRVQTWRSPTGRVSHKVATIVVHEG